jgi:putative transposase
MSSKIQFSNDNYYHILNRGVDGRQVFLDEFDYKRFLESLENFNTKDHKTIQRSRLDKLEAKPLLEVSPLVEIVCYCLLPNHFHLLLRQLKENGISKFMQKVGTGYSYYFNTKYNRRGALFQGSFKPVLIKDNSQFLHISRYIHLNALDSSNPGWREGKICNWDLAKKNLENYLWSSYPVFIGRKKIDICHPESLLGAFESPADYENFMREWSERGLIITEDLE